MIKHKILKLTIPFLKTTITKKKKKVPRKKKKKILSLRAQSRDEKPTIEEVKTYFFGQNFPELEAQKFFNDFSSNG